MTEAAPGTNVIFHQVDVAQGTFTAPSGILTLRRFTSSTNAVLVIAASGASFLHNNGTIHVNVSRPAGSLARQSFYLNGNPLSIYNLIVEMIDTDATGGLNQFYFSVESGSTLNILGDTEILDGFIAGGTFNYYGNLTLRCSSASSCAEAAPDGAVAHNFVGAAPQTITAEAGAGGFGSNINVNKSSASDTVTLVSALSGWSEPSRYVRVTQGILVIDGVNMGVDGDAQAFGPNGTLECVNGGTLTVTGTRSGNIVGCP